MARSLGTGLGGMSWPTPLAIHQTWPLSASLRRRRRHVWLRIERPSARSRPPGAGELRKACIRNVIVCVDLEAPGIDHPWASEPDPLVIWRNAGLSITGISTCMHLLDGFGVRMLSAAAMVGDLGQ